MFTKLKKLADQVLVITGASSGIGRVTAETAAKRGAKVVLAAQNGQKLDKVVAQITARGGDAVAVPCDVSDRAQVDRLADAAVEHFGRIDTWVNDAGTPIYGWLDEVKEEDSRKLFDINFWGTVNGSLAALPHLNKDGGALINLGSEVSEAALPLLGMYAASKQAVKGFTDALRVEIEDVDEAPVSITLIQPTAVDTTDPAHARNGQDYDATLPTPIIAPQQVADAILDAAVTPTRVKRVGVMAVFNTAIAKIIPALGDKMAGKQADRQQHDEAPRNPDRVRDHPSQTNGTAGRTHGTNGREPS